MPVRVHPGADEDIRKAHRYYLETAGIEIASRFRGEVRGAFARIERFPTTWPMQFGARRSVLRSFPYSVFYEVDELGPVIVAVCHHKQKPGQWKSRMQGPAQQTDEG